MRAPSCPLRPIPTGREPQGPKGGRGGAGSGPFGSVSFSDIIWCPCFGFGVRLGPLVVLSLDNRRSTRTHTRYSRGERGERRSAGRTVGLRPAAEPPPPPPPSPSTSSSRREGRPDRGWEPALGETSEAWTGGPQNRVGRASRAPRPTPRATRPGALPEGLGQTRGGWSLGEVRAEFRPPDPAARGVG